MSSHDSLGSGSGPEMLEFPSWSGMDDSTNRISPEAALRLCEEYKPWLQEFAGNSAYQRPEKCRVDFVL
jgi:hypothetical protein